MEYNCKIPPKITLERLKQRIPPKTLSYKIQEAQRESRNRIQENEDKRQIISGVGIISTMIGLHYAYGLGYISEFLRVSNDFLYDIIH